MEKVRNVALYLLSLDTDNKIFTKNLVTKNKRNCYDGNVRLNKYLHICQMVYMAMNNEKLFDEEMYAYDNGVIIEEVMQNYAILLSRKNEAVDLKDDTKNFLSKMFNILYEAPLEDLIKISHQDKEWIDKSKFYRKEDQKIDPYSQIENYKKMCANFIYLMENSYC